MLGKNKPAIALHTHILTGFMVEDATGQGLYIAPLAEKVPAHGKMRVTTGQLIICPSVATRQL